MVSAPLPDHRATFPLQRMVPSVDDSMLGGTAVAAATSLRRRFSMRLRMRALPISAVRLSFSTCWSILPKPSGAILTI